MKKLLPLVILVLAVACRSNVATDNKGNSGDKLSALLENYWQEYIQLFPLEATAAGDNRYNDKLTVTIAEPFRDSVGRFYKRYLDEVSQIDTAGLKSNELISYKV